VIERALRTADTRQAKIDALDLAFRYAWSISRPSKLPSMTICTNEWQEYPAGTHRHEAELVAAACVALAETKDHQINPSSALIDHVSECCRWQHSVST
jgi:hypothetical protein